LRIARSGFKKALFGYRRSDVDEALAARDGALAESAATCAAQSAELEARRIRIAELELVADGLSERVVARDRELRELRAELGRLRADGDDGLRSLTALADELEDVRSQARGQATRIRMRALRDAAELTRKVSELNGRSPAEHTRVLDSIADAVVRIEGDEDEAAPAAGSNGHAPGRAAADMFDGLIEVEIGPLSDFSQLVGFEDAAGAIGATSQISVKRFAQGRATLEMKLAEPVELLRELEERSPFEFRVRDQRTDRLILDVGEE
jgi:hypothetical protein